MTEFSDRPFMVGSLIGLRAFRIDSLGRLTGPSFKGVFQPGENVAECKGATLAMFSGLPDGATVSRTYGAMSYGAMVPAGPPPRLERDFEVSLPDHEVRLMTLEEIKEEYPPKPHTTASQTCTCGFYAYFDGSNDYHNGDGTLAAVVEGYGLCTVGERGFRAQKARLLALVDPEPMPSLNWWDRHANKVLAPLWILNLIGLVLRLLHPTWWATLNVVAITALGASWYFQHKLLNAKKKAIASRSGSFEMVRRNYPDTPVYGSLKRALAAHPLTTPEPITPETADDFWTREVR